MKGKDIYVLTMHLLCAFWIGILIFAGYDLNQISKILGLNQDYEYEKEEKGGDK